MKGGTPADLTSAQADRRQRILNECLRVAAAGGYDSVRMRCVADGADVAIGTLYRHFPSKDQLLVCAFSLWLRKFEDLLMPELGAISDPYRRLGRSIALLNSSMYRTPLLAEALTRAYAVAGTTMSGEVESARGQLVAIFARVMGGTHRIELYWHIGELLADQWASNVLALKHRRIRGTEFQQRLADTVTILAQRHHVNIGIVARMSGVVGAPSAYSAFVPRGPVAASASGSSNA